MDRSAIADTIRAVVAIGLMALVTVLEAYL